MLTVLASFLYLFIFLFMILFFFLFFPQMANNNQTPTTTLEEVQESSFNNEKDAAAEAEETAETADGNAVSTDLEVLAEPEPIPGPSGLQVIRAPVW